MEESLQMKIARRGMLVAVLIFAGVARVRAAWPKPLPATMAVDANSAPFWISAAAATARDGRMREDVFPAGVREIVQAHGFPITGAVNANANAEPCRQLAIVNNDEPVGRGTSSGGPTTRAEGIFSGTVTAVTEGFLNATPASILTVHVDEVLRDASGVSAFDDVFVPYFAADFTIDGTRFCNAGLPRNGVSYVPQIGDKVLVLFSATPVGRYINVRDQQLFLAHADQVYPPRRLPGGFPDARSFSDLVRKVKAELAGQEISK